jgi:alginate O-acetyltransferase complex protein AlgI
MLFNSIHFLFFFLFVTAAYFILPYSRRWILLLASSCYFYMAFVPVYILILAGTIVIDYFAGIWIENAPLNKKKRYLILSLIANVGVLVVFKYYNFFNENLSFLLKGFALDNPIPFLHILLPIGLSFHTFQAMSYTIEVYRGNQKAEKHFGIYSLYVMFYPQLVAGPIERPQNILHQFREKFDFDYNRVTSGLRLMAWGIFKKVVIADRLAIVVDHVFDHPTSFNSLSLIIASIFFTFQIFCDFSGYSDVAIGAARVMGYDLMRNFNMPYHSKTIKEFWSKWHISLSTWFKDYVYIPLGGNRVAVPRWYLNLFIIFLLSGIWHGANWTFIIWGLLHGLYQVFGLMTLRYRQSIIRFFRLSKFSILSLISTFLLVNFAWIFFRAKDVTTAFDFIHRLFSKFLNLLYEIKHGGDVIEDLKLPNTEIIACFLLIAFMEFVHFSIRKFEFNKRFVFLPSYARWLIYFIFLFSILFFGVDEERQFIYFQF